jgi:hypothetical protein
MKYNVIILILFALILTGCAGLEAPTPERFIPPWSGASALHLGDKKDYVISQWGEPEYINQLGVDEVGLVKEEWVYAGRKLPVIEIEPKMLVKGKNLIFTGNALTGYVKKDKE